MSGVLGINGRYSLMVLIEGRLGRLGHWRLIIGADRGTGGTVGTLEAH
jgi:hypothetical protein